VHFDTETGKIQARKPSTSVLARQPVGLSLRGPHLADLFALAPALGFVEVRASDIGALDGVPQPSLKDLAARWPMAVQASEIGLSGEIGLTERPLEELERTSGLHLRRISLPLTPERDPGALAAVVEVIQSHVGQPVLLELGQHADALADTLKLADLARQTPSRLTVEPDLGHFSGIVPCGITDGTVTSMATELGQAPSSEEVKRVLALEFQTLLPKFLAGQ